MSGDQKQYQIGILQGEKTPNSTACEDQAEDVVGFASLRYFVRPVLHALSGHRSHHHRTLATKCFQVSIARRTLEYVNNKPLEMLSFDTNHLCVDVNTTRRTQLQDLTDKWFTFNIETQKLLILEVQGWHK